MSKAPAALGAGEARTWPCGTRAPLGQPWQNTTHTTTERGLVFGRRDKKSWCSKKTMGWRPACAAPHAR
jgi:hypothetical protein